MRERDRTRDGNPAQRTADDPSIGSDEWVAEVEQRRRGREGLWGRLYDRWEAISETRRMLIIVGLIVSMPLVTATPPALTLLGISNNNFIVRVGTMFLAFSILAIGLNVVAGYAGLLDLGYAAFFGIAGYSYAYMSSDFIGDGVHVPSLIGVPLVIAITAGIGWLLGSSSLRLRGDYLAIVTLGFGLLFVQLVLTLTRVKIPGIEGTVDLTRGPNGINRLDDISVFGFTFSSTIHYYYLFFILLASVYLIVTRIRNSRIGRAWRSMREDELATEVLGTPTRKLKLLAFSMGAAIAGLAGALFAAWQGNVVPNRYDVLLLIELYAMVVLGGLGSLPGAVLGAFIFTVLPELLRNVELAGFLFYMTTLGGLIYWLRVPRRLAAVLGGTVVGGFALKLAVGGLAPGLDAGTFPAEGSLLNQAVQAWLIVPEDFKTAGNIAISLAILATLGIIYSKSSWRWVWLGVTVYLAAFSWETRLATEASVTRILIVGLSLIVLMVRRPQGLLGKLRVTIV